MPEQLKDIMRASTVLILIVVASTWVTGDLTTIYIELFDSFSTIILSTQAKHMIVFIVDVLIHVVPVFLIGLPKKRHSMMIATLVLMTWYGMVRERIHEIYSPSVPADRGVMIAVLSGFGGAAVL
jgi:hypothetical protein